MADFLPIEENKCEPGQKAHRRNQPLRRLSLFDLTVLQRRNDQVRDREQDRSEAHEAELLRKRREAYADSPAPVRCPRCTRRGDATGSKFVWLSAPGAQRKPALAIPRDPGLTLCLTAPKRVFKGVFRGHGSRDCVGCVRGSGTA